MCDVWNEISSGGAVWFTFASFAGHDSQEAQQADLVDGQAGVGPGGVQAATRAALLVADASHQHHVAARLLTLLEPAGPSYAQATRY